jgi:hypothetical protein
MENLVNEYLDPPGFSDNDAPIQKAWQIYNPDQALRFARTKISFENSYPQRPLLDPL